MIAEFTAGAGAFKAAIDVVKGLKGALTHEAVLRVQIVLGEQIGRAREAYEACSKRVAVLEKELLDRENWEAEIQRYELKRIAPGVSAYVVKPEIKGDEPVHAICTDCAQDRKKAILNALGNASGHMVTLQCGRCKKTYRARAALLTF